MDYLKPEKYYNDLYDLITINRGIEILKFWQELYANKEKRKELKDIEPEEIEKGFNYFSNFQLMNLKADRYKNKETTIKEWTERDKRKKDKLDNTEPPKNIKCTKCGVEMTLQDFKHLDDFDDSKPLRVLFVYECPKCKKRRAIYDTGEERIRAPDLCPKCNKELKVTSKEKNEVSITTYKCSHCSYKNVDTYDFGSKRKEREQEEAKDKKLLETYRERFCVSDKEGKELIEIIEAIEVAGVVHDEEVHKFDDPAFEQVQKINKLSVTDLEKLLTEITQNANFIKLNLEKPEVSQHVVIPFTVQDANSSRNSRNSQQILEETINKKLKDTNWRLISNSTSYRLGILGGRLKGFETEEDLLKLAGKIEPKPVVSKISDEMRHKYEFNNIVQLAKLTGEFHGKENVKKRRLLKEPDGFYLGIEEGRRQCSICSEYKESNELWWNLDGQRCPDCIRNIKGGVIPSLKPQYEEKCNWATESSLKYNHGLTTPIIRKLKKEGSLKGRELLRENGQVYFSVYLKSENKDFFEKYPKISHKIEHTIPTNDGKSVKL